MGVIFGCSSSQKDLNSAKLEADKVHELLSLGLYSQIYNNSTTEFKQNNPESKIVKFLTDIDNKFGKPKEIKFIRWNINNSTSFSKNSTVVILVYDVQYERGHGIETIYFHNENGVMGISGYNIQSDEPF